MCVLTEVEEKIELEHPETAAIPATVKKPKAVRRVKSEVIYPIFHSARLRYINYTARTSACGGAPPYSLRRKSWEPISGGSCEGYAGAVAPAAASGTLPRVSGNKSYVMRHEPWSYTTNSGSVSTAKLDLKSS